MKTITQTRYIVAPKETIWMVLLEDEFNRSWLAEFAPGTYFDTDWIVGHPLRLWDGSGGGRVGTIEEKRPYDRIEWVYEGLITTEGSDDLTGVEAMQCKGGSEVFALASVEDGTLLTVSSDVSDASYETMKIRWEAALDRIIELSLAV